MCKIIYLKKINKKNRKKPAAESVLYSRGSNRLAVFRVTITG